jgi:hypothetical protein
VSQAKDKPQPVNARNTFTTTDAGGGVREAGHFSVERLSRHTGLQMTAGSLETFRLYLSRCSDLLLLVLLGSKATVLYSCLEAVVGTYLQWYWPARCVIGWHMQGSRA